EEKETLRVEFTNGSVYQYHDVPKTIYEELEKSPSKGQYFNGEIKDKFGFDREN
ncbi:KTSC domain-containing protein, partial [Crocosphaera watsonii]